VTVEEILAWLEERRADEHDLSGMARYGIRTDNAYGVKVPELRRLARSLGHDHGLAAELWSAGRRETRLLAGMVDEPERVSLAQMDHWARDFDSWDVCDGVCMDLFRHTSHVERKAREWTVSRRHGFVRRAGLVLIALLARPRGLPDAKLPELLPLAAEAAQDGRNEVIKGASWGLRNIANRSPALRSLVLTSVEELRDAPERGARWVASDVRRRLSAA
jgi:3-methyladenine DNA glycosylase AlkD